MEKIFKEVDMKIISEKSKIEGMENDRIIKQTFTCCGHTNERFLWEGWDWASGNIISKDLLEKFEFCPYCGKKLTKEE